MYNFIKKESPADKNTGGERTQLSQCVHRVVEKPTSQIARTAYIPPQMIASIPKESSLSIVAGSQYSSSPRFSPGKLYSAEP